MGIEYTKQLKQNFVAFCEENFPGKKINANIENKYPWFYVSAGSSFSEDVHYEFFKGHVQLHNELDNPRKLNDFIEKNLTDKIITKDSSNSRVQWTYNKDVEYNNEENVFKDFCAIRDIMEPLIKKYEFLMDIEDGISANVVSVETILDYDLDLPNYQRPYVWTKDNVNQLLEDIYSNFVVEKYSYLIGSIILYYNKTTNKFEIVDGQQRITTILLILKCLKKEKELLNNLKFNHISSCKNIRNNNEHIRNWCITNIAQDKRDSFINYLCKKCEFVKIIVTDLSEAFQMFDSQNGRGKPLEAYNLLKAYHLRAMAGNTQDEKIKADKEWENAARYPITNIDGKKRIKDILKQLFNEQLYRSRKWASQTSAGKFGNDKIKEFKGYTIDKNTQIEYPYQNPQLLQYITSKFYANVLSGAISMKSRYSNGDDNNINPFTSINQDIINGKAFFEYIRTYVELYKSLFIDLESYQLREFKIFYKKYCLEYEDACKRKGDKYLRELYKSLIFMLFDRFGEEVLLKYYKILYAIVYKLRLENIYVKYPTVDKYPHKFFFIIQNAKSIDDLYMLDEYKFINKKDIRFRGGDKNELKKYSFYNFFNEEKLIRE